MSKNNKLPYFQINGTNETKKIAISLLRKLKKKIREKNSFHYLIFAKKHQYLNFIKKNNKEYKYFLKIDIEKYYPSINHNILLKILNSIPEFQTRRIQVYVKKQIPEFLKQGPIKNKSLTIGNYLAWVLAGIYLLPLDFKIPRPFLRIQDDYLIFCKDKKDVINILKNIITPELEKLELNINIKKLKSGRFYKDKVNFIGFNFFAGCFTIHPEKIEEFKKRIIKITNLNNKKKSKKIIIKKINYKILGFGHYYKFTSCKNDFKKLDAWIRMRIRRYLLENRLVSTKESNLLFTNEILNNLNLKSLEKIKNNLELKNKLKNGINKKKRVKTGKKKSVNWNQIEEMSLKYQRKMMFKEIKLLTSLVQKIEQGLVKNEKKVVNKKNEK